MVQISIQIKIDSDINETPVDINVTAVNVTGLCHLHFCELANVYYVRFKKVTDLTANTEQ